MTTPAFAEDRHSATTTRLFRVAMVGNPNCGKTTLFNALTGSRHKVGNYAGVTVEKREGHLVGDPSIRILDLPGTYSLASISPDEAIVRDVLLGHASDTPRPDAVLLVADASNLERNLFLAGQVIELGLPVVLACNMIDQVERSGCQLDLARLGEQLGVEVIGTVGSSGKGVDDLHAAVTRARVSDRPRPSRRWSASKRIEAAVKTIADSLMAAGHTDPATAEGTALLLLCHAEVSTQNHLPPSVQQSLLDTERLAGTESTDDPSAEIIRRRYDWLREVVDTCMTGTRHEAAASATDRLDRVLTHRIWGYAFFAAIMTAVFCGLFAAAAPLISLIDTCSGWLRDQTIVHLPSGVLRDLLSDGIIAGVGAVLAFFPQVCILFLLMALLEDSGYMARAAFLMNRVMTKVGLNGKSFIPLLSCHACAVPGIMATRTIENSRDRLATILAAPFMSCSARLPVYALLIGACLPTRAWFQGAALLGLYAFGVAAGFAVAKLFKRTLLRGPDSGFIIELPPYRMPRPTAVLLAAWDRGKLFLTKAGTIILAATIVIWALTHYPWSSDRAVRFARERAAVEAGSNLVPHTELERQLIELNQQERRDRLDGSFAGQLGRTLEPILRPMGFNWQIGVGLMSSFAARELFVSTMSIVCGGGDTDAHSPALRDKLRAATWPDGRPLFTPLTAIALLVFFALACQCLSTIAVVHTETGTWRWSAFMISYMSALAYLTTVLVYQTGTAMGF
ncbi:MAG TPA: ferrous iron transport protein B [Phycisphaerae bacterium]|nr:ferrous iron transport protein B [Phycisphaerae bacterium]HRY69371.1 ferrous iron transport protein B [Phycisphaerae bacterium]HSA26238.1 ferrous iron transport protein B [Phycisphaerae bacterium]